MARTSARRGWRSSATNSTPFGHRRPGSASASGCPAGRPSGNSSRASGRHSPIAHGQAYMYSEPSSRSTPVPQFCLAPSPQQLNRGRRGRVADARRPGTASRSGCRGRCQASSSPQADEGQAHGAVGHREAADRVGERDARRSAREPDRGRESRPSPARTAGRRPAPWSPGPRRARLSCHVPMMTVAGSRCPGCAHPADPGEISRPARDSAPCLAGCAAALEDRRHQFLTPEGDSS